jgi:hypothetical protein
VIITVSVHEHKYLGQDWDQVRPRHFRRSFEHALAGTPAVGRRQKFDGRHAFPFLARVAVSSLFTLGLFRSPAWPDLADSERKRVDDDEKGGVGRGATHHAKYLFKLCFLMMS